MVVVVVDQSESYVGAGCGGTGGGGNAGSEDRCMLEEVEAGGGGGGDWIKLVGNGGPGVVIIKEPAINCKKCTRCLVNEHSI